jgi:hypothetical protein
MRSRILCALAAIVTGLASAPALAQQESALDCGDPTSELVDRLSFQFANGSVTFQEALEQTTAAADSCPTNNFAQHFASLAWQAVLTERSKQQGVQLNELTQIWLKAFSYNERLWAMPLSERLKGYALADFNSVVSGRKRNFPLEQANDTRKSLVQWALIFHTKYGATAAYVSRAAPAQCPEYVTTDSFGLRDWVRDEPAGAVNAAAVLERYETVCPMAQTFERRGPHRIFHINLANIRLAAAEHLAKSDPAQAHDTLQKVRAYRDHVLKFERVSSSDWSDFPLRNKLTEIEASLPLRQAVPTGVGVPLQSAGNLPVESWFDQSAHKEVVLESIGQTINAYTVELGAIGVGRVVSKAFALAKQSASPNEAFPLIYQAANSYKNGKYRSLETKDTRVFEAIYEWLKDYSI